MGKRSAGAIGQSTFLWQTENISNFTKFCPFRFTAAIKACFVLLLEIWWSFSIVACRRRKYEDSARIREAGFTIYSISGADLAHCCAIFLGHLGIDKSKYQREIIWLGNQLEHSLIISRKLFSSRGTTHRTAELPKSFFCVLVHFVRLPHFPA